MLEALVPGQRAVANHCSLVLAPPAVAQVAEHVASLLPSG